MHDTSAGCLVQLLPKAADLMDEDRGAVGAALHLRDEVVDALPRVGRDRAQAEGAERIAGRGVGLLRRGLHGTR